jgi:hypothetical protein
VTHLEDVGVPPATFFGTQGHTDSGRAGMGSSQTTGRVRGKFVPNG